ncbi:hypothetical protein M8997_004140 [Phyllobacterium sp. 21LDTY02-6]|uniref:hypothetical protein n=1 Tax=Phyllobacterium sp. 21LDTY02-6 TaxID=2944903 RepID=UPI00202100D6|nr:hypothetical protein [Phyllobacterium sp. 21LDTY02-6]MCO4316363.1 hypothetical protein [Phyllobacterium sp. 21LDTY02-6]
MTDILDMTLNFNPNGQRLLKALRGDDDIGSLVRCQFEADRAAIAVLEKLTHGRYKPQDDKYLTERLRLCRLFGVSDRLIQPLRTLNKHRNAFAHDGTDEITEQQFLDLFRQVKEVYEPLEELTLAVTKEGSVTSEIAFKRIE